MLCTDDLCLDIYELIQNSTQTTTVESWIKWICDHTLNRRRSVNVETKSPSHSLIIFFGAMNGPRKLVSLRETMLRGFPEQPNLGELDSRSTMQVIHFVLLVVKVLLYIISIVKISAYFWANVCTVNWRSVPHRASKEQFQNGMEEEPRTFAHSN